MKCYLILMTVIIGVIGVFSITPATELSVLIFDAPGSESDPLKLVSFGAISTFPVSCLLGILTAWIAFKKGRNKLARWIIWLPGLNILILGLVLVIEGLEVN